MDASTRGNSWNDPNHERGSRRADSTAQQLITTAWNQIVAIFLVCIVFGWAGGKQIVSESDADARARTVETKEDHRRKRHEKKERRRMARAEKHQTGGQHDE